MNRQILLRRVMSAHMALLAAAAIFLHARGLPLDGLFLGGLLGGFAFVTFWAIARTLVDPSRKALAYVLGSMKILLYFGLTAAVLTGRLVADPLGFAIGITCFVASIVGVALVAPPVSDLADQYGGT